jgi:hypothetical protein
VTKLANGVMYFPGTQQITDPSAAAVISPNGLNGNFTNRAITDAKGNLLFGEAPSGIECSLAGNGSRDLDASISTPTSSNA